MAELFEDHSRAAVISACGRYRYRLDRVIGRDTDLKSPRRVCWIMLNPSTADGKQDDPTLRRIMRFTEDWGFTRLSVVNLFAWRATKPTELAKAGPLAVGGSEADRHIRDVVSTSNIVVCGWGNSGPQPMTAERIREIKAILATYNQAPLALATTKAGEPRHPLYLKANLLPRPL